MSELGEIQDKLKKLMERSQRLTETLSKDTSENTDELRQKHMDVMEDGFTELEALIGDLAKETETSTPT